MSKDPLEAEAPDASDVQDASATARFLARHPKLAITLGAFLVLGISTAGPLALRAAASWLGVATHPAAVEYSDSHDAGAGRPAADARLREIVGAAVREQLAAQQQIERDWYLGQLQAGLDRVNGRIDDLILRRGGLASNSGHGAPTPWAQPAASSSALAGVNP